jgi:phospholipid transport system transporter-binding protein
MIYITAENNTWKLRGNLVVDKAETVLAESLALPMDDTALVVDFAAVNIVDTTALALVLAWKRRAKEEFSEISFINFPDNLMSLASLYGVQDFILKH